MLQERYRVSEMGETITATYTYPLLLCAEALPLAAIQHPVQEGHWRTCDTVEIPSGVVSFVYDWKNMPPVFRMVTYFETGSPATNSAVTTADWEWIGTGSPSSSSYEAVEAKYDAFFDALEYTFGAGTRIKGYRWSQWKNDYSGTDPSFRFASRETVTGNGSLLPPQVACAVTEETDIRRRWGRFYLPFLSQGIINAAGRIQSSTCTTIGAAAVTLLDTIEDEWRHVTVSSLTPNLLATNFVRVDDVPDVIRSRRFGASTFRYRNAVT